MIEESEAAKVFRYIIAQKHTLPIIDSVCRLMAA